MRRGDFSAGLLIAVTAMQSALAQKAANQYRMAIVVVAGKPEAISEAGSAFWRTFFEELRHLGHVEGRDLIVERYSAEGHPSPDFSYRLGIERQSQPLHADIVTMEGCNLRES